MLARFGHVVSHGGVVMATGAGGECSHGVYSQEAERDRRRCSAHFLLIQPRTPAREMVPPTVKANHRTWALG